MSCSVDCNCCLHLQICSQVEHAVQEDRAAHARISTCLVWRQVGQIRFLSPKTLPLILDMPIRLCKVSSKQEKSTPSPVIWHGGQSSWCKDLSSFLGRLVNACITNLQVSIPHSRISFKQCSCRKVMSNKRPALAGANHVQTPTHLVLNRVRVQNYEILAFHRFLEEMVLHWQVPTLLAFWQWQVLAVITPQLHKVKRNHVQLTFLPLRMQQTRYK